MQKEGRIVDGAYGIDNAELFILFDQIAAINDISSQQYHDPKRKAHQDASSDKCDPARHDLRFGIQRKQAVVLVCRTHRVPFVSSIFDAR